MQKVFSLKTQTSDRGRFTGRASVYEVMDLQGDIVVRGAFTKTIKESDGKIKILNQHNPADCIGVGRLFDSHDALMLDGQLELELQSGREAYVRLTKGLIDGLSIGYSVVTEGYSGRARLLKQIDLHEVSLVTFPANPLSRIESVKRRGDEAELKSLLDTLRSINLAIRHDRDRREADELRTVIQGLREARASFRK